MPKFTTEVKTVYLKKGKKQIQTIITATNENNLLTLQDLTKIINKFEKEGYDTSNYKIMGRNQQKFYTIKSTGEVYDNRFCGSDENIAGKKEYYNFVIFS